MTSTSIAMSLFPRNLQSLSLLLLLLTISSIYSPQHDTQDAHHVRSRVAGARGPAESWLGRLKYLMKQFSWSFHFQPYNGLVLSHYLLQGWLVKTLMWFSCACTPKPPVSFILFCTISGSLHASWP